VWYESFYQCWTKDAKGVCARLFGWSGAEPQQTMKNRRAEFPAVFNTQGVSNLFVIIFFAAA
jgi:hypothetical protein